MSHQKDDVRDCGSPYKPLFLRILCNAADANRGGIRCSESVTNREIGHELPSQTGFGHPLSYGMKPATRYGPEIHGAPHLRHARQTSYPRRSALPNEKPQSRPFHDHSIDRLPAHKLKLPPHSVIESLPVFSAARAMPDLPTLIFSAYCNGMRGDFHPPAWVIAARSMSRAARS